MLSRLFYRQLPTWARPSHPLMRYALGQKTLTGRDVALRGLLLVLVVLLVLAYGLAAESLVSPSYRELLYYPLVALQLIIQLLALTLTANAIALERQKGTWESLQITLVGAANTIRTRWALVFYRLRWLLGLVLLLRLGYAALLIHDTTAFEGRAIDLRIIGIAPEASLELAIFLLAALLTAFVLQTFVWVALDAALGILLGTLLHRRGVGILTTVVLLMLRVLITGGALLAGNEILSANGTRAAVQGMPAEEAWARVLLLASQGDNGLRLMSLEALGSLWADLPEGLYLGGVLLLLVMVMATLANLLVLFAARRAGKPNRV